MLLAACTTPGPLPTLAPTLPLPVNGAPPPNITATPAPTETPFPTATPVPIELVVCQTNEPLSLYLYGDDVSARAGIFEALYDGPVDSVGYRFQPVILQDLPTLENSGLSVRDVEVRPGDRVVDAISQQVVLLTEGTNLAQADGTAAIYSGGAPALTVQVSAQFQLKPGLLWSDGAPLTADDSRFSFELASSPDTPTGKFAADRTAAYEVVDALTMRWTGLPGWRDTDYAKRFWTPFPRHKFGALSPKDLLFNEEAARRPLGWGGFMLESWAQGNRLTLVRNPNYFRAAEGLPLVDRVVFRFGLAPEQIIAELEAGRCHIGSAEADFTGLATQLRASENSGLLRPHFVPTTAFEHLDFGIQPAEDYRRAAGNDFFQDLRLRQAIAYCLDRQALINQLMSGVGDIPAAYLPGNHPDYAADRVTVYPFDPAQGQSRLQEAGWVDRDGDGLREKGAQRLALNYVSGPEESPFRALLAQLLQTQLREHCGVALNLQWVSDVRELYAAWPAGPIFGRRFDLTSYPWRAGHMPPCDVYLTASIADDQHPAGANNTGYSNPDFDAACQRALTTFNEAVRSAQHSEAQAIFTRDLPSLPLFFHFKAGAARPEVRGYQLDSTAQSDLWNIETLALSEP